LCVKNGETKKNIGVKSNFWCTIIPHRILNLPRPDTTYRELFTCETTAAVGKVSAFINMWFW